MLDIMFAKCFRFKSLTRLISIESQPNKVAVFIVVVVFIVVDDGATSVVVDFAAVVVVVDPRNLPLK